MRDVALDKNRSRKGYLRRLMTAFANVAISILQLLRTRNIPRRTGPLKMPPNGAVARLTG